MGGLNNVESPEYRALNNVISLEYRPPITEALAEKAPNQQRCKKIKAGICADCIHVENQPLKLCILPENWPGKSKPRH